MDGGKANVSVSLFQVNAIKLTTANSGFGQKSTNKGILNPRAVGREAGREKYSLVCTTAEAAA